MTSRSGLAGKRSRTREILETVQELKREMTFGIGRQVRELLELREKRDDLIEDVDDRLKELESSYDALVELVEESIKDIEFNEEVVELAEERTLGKVYQSQYSKGYNTAKTDLLEGRGLNHVLLDEKNPSTEAVGYRAGVARVEKARRTAKIK